MLLPTAALRQVRDMAGQVGEMRLHWAISILLAETEGASEETIDRIIREYRACRQLDPRWPIANLPGV